MKKTLIFALAMIMLLAFTACDDNGATANPSQTATATDAPTTEPTATPTATAAPTEAPTAAPTEAPTAAPTAKPTNNVSTESLYNGDYGIDGILKMGESAQVGVECITGDTLLEYAGYAYEGPEREGMEFEISSAALFEYLDKHFVLNDTLKAEMKQARSYDSASDKFFLSWPGSNLNKEIVGYVHNGGNSYTVYYHASTSGGQEMTVYWKAELEYNLPDGKPNRYISFVVVQTIPENITK